MSSSHFASNLLIPSSNNLMCYEDFLMDSDAPNEGTILCGGRGDRQLLMCEEEFSDSHLPKEEPIPSVEKPIEKIRAVISERFYLSPDDGQTKQDHSERVIKPPKGKREISSEAIYSISKRKKVEVIPEPSPPSKPKKVRDPIMTRSKAKSRRMQARLLKRGAKEGASRSRSSAKLNSKRDIRPADKGSSVLIEDFKWSDSGIGCARTKFWKFRRKVSQYTIKGNEAPIDPREIISSHRGISTTNSIGVSEVSVTPIGGELQQLFPEIDHDQHHESVEG